MKDAVTAKIDELKCTTTGTKCADTRLWAAFVLRWLSRAIERRFVFAGDARASM